MENTKQLIMKYRRGKEEVKSGVTRSKDKAKHELPQEDGSWSRLALREKERAKSHHEI